MTKIKLTQDAYLQSGTMRLPTETGASSIYVLDGSWYEAAATDDDGNDYMVYWNILEESREDWADGDEGSACDWKHPAWVVKDVDGRTYDVSAEVTLTI